MADGFEMWAKLPQGVHPLCYCREGGVWTNSTKRHDAGDLDLWNAQSKVETSLLAVWSRLHPAEESLIQYLDILGRSMNGVNVCTGSADGLKANESTSGWVIWSHTPRALTTFPNDAGPTCPCRSWNEATVVATKVEIQLPPVPTSTACCLMSWAVRN